MNRSLKTIALGLGLATAAAGTAAAQDFDGFYLGAYGSGDVTTSPNTYGFGANAGYLYEFTPGGYVGVEGDAYFPMSNPNIYTASARLGYDFGTPFMVYGQVGAGMDSTGTSLWTVGAGGEYAVGGNTSVRLGVDRYQPFSGGPANYVAKVGLNYRF